MVILQFNKLIRNKWFWGVFAVLISVAFVLPDDWFSSRGEGADGEFRGQTVGKIDGKPVTAQDLSPVLEDLRQQRRQGADYSEADLDRDAREIYSALEVARRNDIAVSDDELISYIQRIPYFQQNGAFNNRQSAAVLRQNGLNESRFEDSQRREMALRRLEGLVASGATWSSPMEAERAVADATDELTVRVVRFKQDPKAAAAVKLDEAGLKKWYEANTNSLALPERIKIRYVKFDATKSNLLARVTVTDEEIQDYYDSTADKYTTTDTNGVETVKKLEEVRPEIEGKLRQIEAVGMLSKEIDDYLATNLAARAAGSAATNGVSQLEVVAKARGLKVETSNWFSLKRDAYVEGFMRRASQILPEAQDFIERCSELDMEDENFRYVVIRSDKAVWLIEKCAVSPAHVPTFAEAKEVIRPRALRDAKADAFKAFVEAEIAKGAKSLLASKDVSTNLTFVASDITGYVFDDQRDVVPAAMKLDKDGVSECIVPYAGSALVVVCVGRKPGDPVKVAAFRTRIARGLSMKYGYETMAAWRKWNAERLGFKADEKSKIALAGEEE